MSRIDPVSKAPRFLMLASVVVVVAALYWARDVLIPLALAILLSFLLVPAVSALERLRLGRIVSVLVVVLLAFMVAGTIGYVVSDQLIDLAQSLPRYKDNIKEKVRSLKRPMGGSFQEVTETVKELGEELAQPATTQAATTQASTQPAAAPLVMGPVAPTEPPTPRTPEPPAPTPATQPISVRIEPPPRSALDFLRDTLGPLLDPLATAGLVVVFAIFILIQREDLRDRLIRLFGLGQLRLTTQALDDAARRVSRYLIALSIVNGTYGVAIALGLWLIGVPNAVLWGLLCALLRFIPYLGPWIAASMPILLSFAAFPTWREPMMTIGLFVVVELISNNFMEPWLYGSSTGISAVAVLVAAVFWTWLWGVIGLLLATPLTVCLVVLGKYVPQLAFLNVLLGDEPVLAPHERYYQRLLALDQEEAEQIVEEHLRDRTLLDVYDTVMVPALALAERDRHRGELDEHRRRFIGESMEELIEELGERSKGDLAEPPTTRAGATVLCLPANDEADEIVATMLAQLLDARGYVTRTAPAGALAGEQLKLLEPRPPDAICISALPPAAARHARYLCKRLRTRSSKLQVVVGVWLARTEAAKLRQRVGCDQDVPIATSLAQAIEQIRQIAQSVVPDNGAAARPASDPPAPTPSSLQPRP